MNSKKLKKKIKRLKKKLKKKNSRDSTWVGPYDNY